MSSIVSHIVNKWVAYMLKTDIKSVKQFHPKVLITEY